MNEPRSDVLVWIDLEMTGLDPLQDSILEIATLITDQNLHIVAEGPSLAIHQPDEAMQDMSAFVRRMHERNGLLGRVEESRVGTEEAEHQTLAFVREHCKVHTSPLCGNSIWMDRMFLHHQMKKLESYLHYRVLDVSTIKELARRWNHPVLSSLRMKPESHRALDDIRASIDELRHYRKTWFGPPQ